MDKVICAFWKNKKGNVQILHAVEDISDNKYIVFIKIQRFSTNRSNWWRIKQKLLLHQYRTI